MTAPARLDITDREEFDLLEPEIGQTFLIGEGAGHRYRAPEGATRLFPDAAAWRRSCPIGGGHDHSWSAACATSWNPTRNRTRRAVERTVPFGLICFSVVTAWYALHGHCVDDVASHRTPLVHHEDRA